MAKSSETTRAARPEELRVDILNREFTLMVSPDERGTLEKAAAMVDQKMRTIRDAGKIGGIDKIAIMAALQIADELVKQGGKRPPAPVRQGPARAGAPATTDAEVLKKVEKLNEKLDAELKNQEDLF